MIQHQAACPGCGLSFEYSTRVATHATDEVELLNRVLIEPEPLHICARCGASISLRVPIVFRHNGLGLEAHVCTDLNDLLAVCRETYVDSPIRPFCISTRAALKHAILRAANFAPELGRLIAANDWLEIMSFCFGENDWSSFADHTSELLDKRVATALELSLQRSQSAGTTSQIRLRTIRSKLHSFNPRLADSQQQSAMTQVLQDQIGLLEAGAEEPTDAWNAILTEKLDMVDPVAIEICWENAKAYREHAAHLVAAVRISQVGVWLSQQFGNFFEQAESAYQFAVTLSMAGHHQPACEQFETALSLYMEALSWHQSLECFKLLGDIHLVYLNRALRSAPILRRTRCT